MFASSAMRLRWSGAFSHATSETRLDLPAFLRRTEFANRRVATDRRNGRHIKDGSHVCAPRFRVKRAFVHGS